MNDNIIKILITAKDEASSVLAGIKSQAAETANASKQFATGLAAAAAANGAFVGFGAKIAGDLEASRAGFITLLGSADEADKVLAQIKKDAASTPFELPGLISANQLLTSVTKDGMRSESMLMNVGKALSAMGKGQPELDRIIVNLQQIGAVGKATMMDVKQFAFAGIPIFEMLQQATGKTGDELSNFISEGGVTFEMLEGMFNDAGAAGGRFADAFKNQAGGFNQLWANMKDTVSMAAADIVTQSGVFDIIKNAMAGVSDWVGKNSGKISDGIKNMFVWVKDNGALVAGVLMGALVPALVATAAGVWATLAPLLPFMAAGALVAVLLDRLAASMGGWGNLIAAVQPILAQVANVVQTVVVNAFNMLLQVWNFLKPSVMQLWASIQQLWGSLMNLWNVLAPVLIPVLKVVATIIGVVIVGAIWVLINGLSMLMNFFTAMYNLAAGIFSTLFTIVSTIINGIIGYFNMVFAVWNYIFSWLRAIVMAVFSAIWDKIGGTMTGIVNSVRGAIDGVVGFFNGIWGRVSGGIGKLGEMVGGAISGAVEGVKGGVKGAINWVIDRINDMISKVNSVADKIPGAPKLGTIPRLYTGGRITQGGIAIVGESGPEAVMLPAGAEVVSNRNSQAAFASGGVGGGGNTVNIKVEYNGRGQFSQADAVDMAKQIRDALKAQGLNMDQLGALRG